MINDGIIRVYFIIKCFELVPLRVRPMIFFKEHQYTNVSYPFFTWIDCDTLQLIFTITYPCTVQKKKKSIDQDLRQWSWSSDISLTEKVSFVAPNSGNYYTERYFKLTQEEFWRRHSILQEINLNLSFSMNFCLIFFYFVPDSEMCGFLHGFASPHNSEWCSRQWRITL